ncbi:MAG: hypothetical protein ACR2QS_12910 [Woeseiaceae bacterium]
MSSDRIRYVTALALLTSALVNPKTLQAGEISGIPSALPPGLERGFAISFGNDFLGRGGSVDDFRTQQLIVSANIGESWLALVDHSILTLSDAPEPGRIDQIAASVGYRLIENSDSSLTIGGGVRSIDDFAGDRMQNGFHRLIDSDIEDLAYTGSSKTELTAWADAQLHRDFASSGTWTAAYWLRGSTLVASNGEWDSSLSALASLGKKNISLWLGLRGDWRSGYDNDRVLTAAANAEEDGALVVGVRFGALILETVQQFSGDASYGQIMLVSSGTPRSEASLAPSKWEMDFALLLPDVELQLAGRRPARLFLTDSSRWHESLVAELRYGQPQFESLNDVSVETAQFGVGMQWERPLAQGPGFASFYAGAGLAWRREQLQRDADSTEAEPVHSAAATIATGLRFFATSLGQRWNYRLQLGLSAVLPFDQKTVQVAADRYTLQKARLGLSLGMSFDFR